MKTIEVKITEIDKGDRNLSFSNLKDEVVNFLYQDTVANSTKDDQLFYILFPFLVARSGNGSLLEVIFDKAIPKVRALNEDFNSMKRRLNAGEYRRMVDAAGLEEIFRFDLFFLLVEAVQRTKEIEHRYSSFLNKHHDIKSTLDRINSKYSHELDTLMRGFRSSEITDVRVDDRGISHDLSKSVYRTVRMRNARSLNFNIQRYTTVKEITSKSPILVSFLQYIDPQIMFDLWDKYHVADYVSGFGSGLADQFQSRVDTKFNLGELINGYLIWKMQGPSDARDKARAEFQKTASRPQNKQVLEDLTETAVDSVMQSDTHRKKEVARLERDLSILEKAGIAARDKEEIAGLRNRIDRLKNIEIETKRGKDTERKATRSKVSRRKKRD